MTAVQSKLSILQLVYPPMSNQEAHWLADDKEVEPLLRRSDFYMIGGRAEAKFLNLVVDKQMGVVTFDFEIGGKFSDAVSISLRELPGVVATASVDLEVEAGEKHLRVWRAFFFGKGPGEMAWSNVMGWVLVLLSLTGLWMWVKRERERRRASAPAGTSPQPASSTGSPASWPANVAATNSNPVKG